MAKKNLCKIVVIQILVIILAFTSSSRASRFNMSFLYGSYDYIELVSRTGNSLNEVSPSYFDLYDSGNLKLNTVDKNLVNEMHQKGIKVVPFLSNHWNREKGRSALNNIEKLTNQIVEAIQKYNLDGVHVDIENVTEKDKNNYTLLVKTLRQKLSQEKTVAVAVAANPYNWQTGWHGSYEYSALAEYADYLMIMTYDEHYESGEAGPVASIGFVEKSIQYALTKVKPEKIVLGIPFFGRYWPDSSYYGGYGVSLTRIETLLSKYKNVVTYDERNQSVKAVITIKSGDLKPMIDGKTLNTGTYTFWYENERSISAKLNLVNKYKLKGTGSWSLGQETASTWNYYTKKLNEGIEINNNNEIEKPANETYSEWSSEAINYVKEKGWMTGKTETEFYAKDNLKRAEFATILVRVLNLNKYSVNNVNEYIDTKNHWAKDSIKLVTASGYMRGYEDNSFKPEKYITREEVANVLSNMKLNEILEDNQNRDEFSDVKNTRWSYNAIKKVAQLGILKGYEDGSFKPQKAISREEMAVILKRAF